MQTRHHAIRTHRSTANASRRGFTLIEISVALAAVLIVAVGLAAIFDSIGKTVATGRRVSRLNQYARMLENQLRSDFGKMSRDGFLVIRQQFADADGTRDFVAADDRVQVFADDERARPRRVDEIMFFARGGGGDFESQRQPLPGLENWRARSNEAAIYYGHGMIRPGSEATDSPPKINDANNFTGLPANVPVLGRAVANNPNRYAKDWILLRKATLLVQPEVTRTPLGGGITGQVYDANPLLAPGIALLADKECQIAGRPAMSTIFRSVNRTLVPSGWEPLPPIFELDRQWWRTTGVGSLGDNYEDPGALNNARFPRAPTLASGLVDIATISLADVRSWVQGFANVQYDYSAIPRTRLAVVSQPSLLPSDYFDGLPPGPFPIAPPIPGTQVAWTDVSPGVGPWTPSRPTATNFESIDYIHAWMDDAMPTRSIDASTMGAPNSEIDASLTAANLAPEPDNTGVATRGTRIRCEVQPPNLLAILGLTPGNATEARGLASLRADAQMLSASNLVVGCSEFAVDWSFGETAPDAGGASPLPLLTNTATSPIFKPSGTTLYYGPPTYRSGANPPANWSAVAGFYQSSDSGLANATGTLTRPVRVNEPALSAPPFIVNGVANLPMSERVIYGFSPMEVISPNIASPTVDVPLSVSSYFGYTDPSFNPDLDLNGVATDPGDARTTQRVLPWEWPRLIRVRVTIADPIDPTNEGTFEFVFNTPAAPAGVQ
jgi:prepilin-type N-terminal cleavage/methylation domain-containing protein